MLRAKAASGLVTAMLIAACGARTPLDVADAPTAVVAPDAGADAPATCTPQCSDDTRGTWRLDDANGRSVGWFFTFDGTTTCNGAAVSFLVVVRAQSNGAPVCSRNGDTDNVEDNASGLQFTSMNLGGFDGPQCGPGDPGDESMRVALIHRDCHATTDDLVVNDTTLGSVYELAVVATRCRCDIGWTPCVEGLPDDPCMP